MDIASWKRSVTNSGMQSTDGKNACIYLSCGGDPFAQNSESHPTQGNGWAALARLQIIAAQELGHLTTRATMHDLYHVYYSEVIPSLIKSYNTVTATECKRNYLHQKNIFRNILSKLGFIKNKTSVQFTEVRDI